jgi:hypothetical protein
VSNVTTQRRHGIWPATVPSSPDARRAPLPPPWTIEEQNDACFIVKDAAARQPWLDS